MQRKERLLTVHGLLGKQTMHGASVVMNNFLAKTIALSS
jgi:hypothetical protein